MTAAAPAVDQPQERCIDWRWAIRAVETSIERREPEIFCRGPAGSSKTLSICDLLHRLALMFPGTVMLWIRKSRERLTESVLKTFETEILSLTPLAALFGGSSRGTRRSYVYPNGSEIMLQGMDDPQRQRSVQADIIWCNEVTELTEDEWEELSRSCRPRMNSPCPYQFKIGDMNPMPPGHWTNQRCKPFPDHLYPHLAEHEDGSRMGDAFTFPMYQEVQEAYNFRPLERSRYKTKMVAFFHADNAGYWSLDPWGWNATGMEYARNQIGRMSGNRKSRYLVGRPMAAQGVVFPEFRRDRDGVPWHVIEPFEIPREWPCIVMKDPGRDHPDVTLCMALSPFYIEFKDQHGQPYRIYKKYFVDEWVTGNESDYGRPSTTAEDAAVLDEWERKYRIVLKLGDPRYMFSATKHSDDGSSIAQQMERLGHTFEPAPTAANEDQIMEQLELIRTHLTTLDKVGMPMIQVFNTCTRLITVGFESYGFRRNAKGEIMPGDDKLEKLNDDEVDGCRFGITRNPQFDDYRIMRPNKVLFRRGPI